jgi:hypothetical protein
MARHAVGGYRKLDSLSLTVGADGGRTLCRVAYLFGYDPLRRRGGCKPGWVILFQRLETLDPSNRLWLNVRSFGQCSSVGRAAHS